MDRIHASTRTDLHWVNYLAVRFVPLLREAIKLAFRS